MKAFFLCVLVVLLIVSGVIPSSSVSHAAQLTLAWDPPINSTDVVGYMIHYGTDSGTYPQSIDVGNVTTYTMSSLNDGQTYYFAATAYNAAGNHSVYSNEVSATTPPAQYLLMISKPGTGQGTVSGQGINCGSICLVLNASGVAVTLNATAAFGSTFDGWSGGGCSGWETCTVSMSGNITVTANFSATGGTTTTTTVPPITSTSSTTSTSATASTSSTTTPTSFPVLYSIAASVNGAGGTISPSGTVFFAYGESISFTSTPSTGYRIAGVLVDGVPVGDAASYTFGNIDTDHTISVSFITDLTGWGFGGHSGVVDSGR